MARNGTTLTWLLGSAGIACLAMAVLLAPPNPAARADDGNYTLTYYDETDFPFPRLITIVVGNPRCSGCIPGGSPPTGCTCSGSCTGPGNCQPCEPVVVPFGGGSVCGCKCVDLQ